MVTRHASPPSLIGQAVGITDAVHLPPSSGRYGATRKGRCSRCVAATSTLGWHDSIRLYKGSVKPRARMERGRRSSTEAHGCNRGLHFCGPPFIEQQHSATSRHLALRTIAKSSVEAGPYSGRRLRRACSRPRPSGRPGPPPPRLEAHLWAQRRKRVLRRSPGTPSHRRQLALRPHEATARSPRRSSWP